MNGSETARERPLGVKLVVGLELELPAVVELARVPLVLGSDDQGWLGEPIAAREPGMRSFLCDLELDAGGFAPTLFHKAAIVSFGEPVGEPERWFVPVEWRAASLSPLFPVFAGQLVIEPERVRLEGRYAPPGGRLGYLLDVALLGVAARQTGLWFLRQVVRTLG